MSSVKRKGVAGGEMPPASAQPAEAEPTVRIWDPLVRLFHWSLVVAFVVAWASGDELRTLHETTGYTIVGLLLVRVVLGLVGSAHARFSDFIYSPATIISYLADMSRLRAKRYLGHNPAGGAMVVALIVMLGATSATGIMMTTDAWWGVEWVEDVHEVLANMLVLLVGLHLVGVFIASAEHRENLVKAMITGRKRAG